MQGPKGDPGVQGPKGDPGLDGLGVDDLEMEYDGFRTFVFRWSAGERKVERSFSVPTMIDRGVWSEGTYEAGDVVSYGGSMFVAKLTTDKKPETDDWRMCVKRGRDGRNGKDGKDGPAGPQGPRGHDLTQLGPDGRKW